MCVCVGGGAWRLLDREEINVIRPATGGEWVPNSFLQLFDLSTVGTTSPHRQLAGTSGWSHRQLAKEIPIIAHIGSDTHIDESLASLDEFNLPKCPTFMRVWYSSLSLCTQRSPSLGPAFVFRRGICANVFRVPSSTMFLKSGVWWHLVAQNVNNILIFDRNTNIGMWLEEKIGLYVPEEWVKQFKLILIEFNRNTRAQVAQSHKKAYLYSWTTKMASSGMMNMNDYSSQSQIVSGQCWLWCIYAFRHMCANV